MVDFTIFTNNPLAYDQFQKSLPDDTIWVNAGAQEVLMKVRTEINRGAYLLSSPLAGGFQHGLNPFKSVLISKPQQQVDFKSVKSIEESINMYKKNAKIKYLSYNDKVLNDLQIIDFDLIASALSGLIQ